MNKQESELYKIGFLHGMQYMYDKIKQLHLDLIDGVVIGNVIEDNFKKKKIEAMKKLDSFEIEDNKL